MSANFNLRRFRALARKETVQLLRDPSTLLIAFVLPVVLLFLFAYAVSLDVREVRIGLVLESDSAAAQSLAAAFSGTRYFSVTPVRDRRQVSDDLVAGTLRGFVVIPQDFEQRLGSVGDAPLIQIITDGSQPNTASFVSAYANGVISTWLAERTDTVNSMLTLEPRIWFNPEIESRRVLIPGAIAIVMTMIGTMLTALVVAREWERGTMEAIMSTPTTILEILVGKLIPYLALGLLATFICTLLAITVFEVPLRGSWIALFVLTLVFLIPALGQGLLISAVTKNQFLASQIAILSGFLPAFLLSGFLYEIDSMPAWIQVITHAVAARYYVSSLQTVFLAGDIWAQFIPDILAMLALGTLFFVITAIKTRKTLDS